MKKWAMSSIFGGLLFAPFASADPVLPVPTDPYGGGGIYGETSPYAQGPNPGAALPQPGLISGTVPGSNAPLATELSTGTSGIRPGTNAFVPGSLSHNPSPDFPDNYFKAPPESLPGQPEPKPEAPLPPPEPDHKWGPIAQGGDSNPDDPENTESAPDISVARQIEPDEGEDEDEPTGDQSFAGQLNASQPDSDDE